MDTYLCEKPEVAKHLASVLNPNFVQRQGYIDCGNDIIVTWCVGHLLQLTDPEDHDDHYKQWSLSHLPIQWPVEYKPNPKTKKQLDVVVRKLKEADRIIISTDIDAAGQHIGDAILEYANLYDDSVERLLINDNHPIKIKQALQDIKKNTDFYGLHLKEKNRAIADMRVGYNLTRLLTKQSESQGYKRLFTVGRVQSAVLGLVVRRYRLRKSHVKQTYYLIKGAFSTPAGELEARYVLPESPMLELDDRGRISDSTQAQQLASSLSSGVATIQSVVTKRTHDSPPLPFDMISLQSEAVKSYGIPPEETLEITQKLRSSPYFAITYNRTDCRYLEDQYYTEAPAILERLRDLDLLKPLVNRADTSIRSRAFNSEKVTAHGAIIPNGTMAEWDTMPEKLKVIYLLIARNFIIQFLPKRERKVTDYVIGVKSASGVPHTFKGKVQSVQEPGWSIVFRNSEDEPEHVYDETINVDALVNGQQCAAINVNSHEQETQAPPEYTTESLLRDIKNTAKYISDDTLRQWMLDKDADSQDLGGIGTPATRDSILKSLFDRNFLERKGSMATAKITPTEEGEILFDMLPVNLTMPNTTAIWAHHFSQIERGEIPEQQFLSMVNEFIESEVARVKLNGLNLPTTSNSKQNQNGGSLLTERCPKCNKTAKRIETKTSVFWKCDSCTSMFSDLMQKPFYKRCPDCRSDMRIIKPKGKRRFVGCNNYPNCKRTEPL